MTTAFSLIFCEGRGEVRDARVSQYADVALARPAEAAAAALHVPWPDPSATGPWPGELAGSCGRPRAVRCRLLMVVGRGS